MALLDAEGFWTGFSARIRVIAYNTKLVKPDEAPQSVFDLADQKWRGQVAMADPRFGSTSFHVAALYALACDEKMDDFFRRLKANDVHIVDENSVVRDMVARGEVRVGLTDTDDVNVAIEDGQPIATLVRIDHVASRYPHQLSGGEQQRVALARTLVAQPRLILFDEPLASLDPELRAHLRQELTSLQRSLGVTSIYVTHDRDDATVVADRIFHMRAGQIVDESATGRTMS